MILELIVNSFVNGLSVGINVLFTTIGFVAPFLSMLGLVSVSVAFIAGLIYLVDSFVLRFFWYKLTNFWRNRNENT